MAICKNNMTQTLERSLQTKPWTLKTELGLLSRSAKSDLYSQNQNLADPAMVAQNAMNRATTLTQMPSYNPLLALFEGVTAGIATQADLERRGRSRYDTGLFSTGKASNVL